MIENEFFRYEVDGEGIATLTIDQKNNPTNLYSFTFIQTFLDTAEKALQDEQVKGVIVTSAQRMFMAGADLRELEVSNSGPEDFLKGSLAMQKRFRGIETGGKPFVAAINGTALGGGMELCLNCHHRIALNNPKTKLGFPEVKVGLLPGGGGTAKAPYLMGIQNALMYILQGVEANPQKAAKDGLIDAVANSPEEMIQMARTWIQENPKPMQPWDNKRHKIPGGGLMTPVGVQTIMGAVGNVRKQTHGNYPAAQYILATVHDGLQVGIDRALEIEARYFTKALHSKEAKNMIRTGFIQMQAARKGKARPKGFEKTEFKKIGMLGAGMMGAGIAYVSAKVGMDVVLKDVSLEAAEKGKAYSQMLLQKKLSKGYTTQEKVDAFLSKIHPTDDPATVADCDMVIEAVFEDTGLKFKVTKETEAVLGADKIYASNTSTIPITELATASKRPEQFIGLHFFSPVDKMPLVEIIMGEKTNDETLAAAMDYVIAIGKTPIVVNDKRGFYTSRTFGTFVNEGIFLLEEGVPAAMIENVAKMKGMPVGPLAVLDEVSLTLSTHVFESDPNPNKSAAQVRGYKILKRMVDEYGRTGKKDGKGLYEYPEGGKKFLWPELAAIFQSNPEAIDKEIVAKRIMHRQALEAFRCLEEGVLRAVVDGDVGSVLGWGFPIYTGGALSYIDYVGIQAFVQDCDAFTEKFGERFYVSDKLRAMAEAGMSIHDYGKELAAS